jgi:hypothetical protein
MQKLPSNKKNMQKMHIQKECIKMIGTIIGGLIGAGTAAYNAAKQEEINEKNWERQQQVNQQNIDFQREQNDLTRAREDNAIQRRVADLKASGLNPLLAAGQGAASAPLTAPRSETSTMEAHKFNEAAMMGATLDAAKAQTEINYMKAQTEKTKAEADSVKEMTAGQLNHWANVGRNLEIQNSEMIQGTLAKSQTQPLKITGMNLDNEAKKLMNDYNRITLQSKVEQQAATVRNMNTENANREADLKLKQMHITPQDIDSLMSNIKHADARLSPNDVEFLAKIQALELAIQAEAINNYNTKVSQISGTKTTESAAGPIKIGTELGTILHNFKQSMRKE